MFEGRVESTVSLNLLCDEVTRHYHVIGNLAAAMARGYVCKACGKWCRRDVKHTCDQTCSCCMASPPCVATGIRIPCADSDRYFRSQTCFANHRRRIGNRKSVCEHKRQCWTCGELVVSGKPHEYGKRYCDVCSANREVGHLCYMRPLNNVLTLSDGVLYVFYGFEITQHTRYSETSKVHVPNLVCIQQFCSRCEDFDDSERVCESCGIGKHVFWDDPVGDLLAYLCEPRLWVKQIIAIAHNAKAFDLHFILIRAVLLKWRLELVMSGQKIILVKMEHMKFIDSVSFLPFPLRKLSAAFGLTIAKEWYTHYFNAENLKYVGSIPDTSYYAIEEMSAGQRTEFLEWYDSQRSVLFDNRIVLEAYCQDDVTVLRHGCQVFRRNILQVGNINVFHKSVTIASACNKVLRKFFLKPDSIGLIHTGGYSGNVNYSKKALMWLVYREQLEGCRIMHSRNGREYRLPAFPLLSVDGFCKETNTVYEF